MSGKSLLPWLPQMGKSLACCLMCGSICAATPAWATSVMSVGQDEGYSGRVLEKIVRKWEPPQQLKRELRLTVVISVDGSGDLLECKVKKASGLNALDASACAAVRAAAPFGSPPYGMPAELYFSFWNGSPEGRAPDDPQKPGVDTSAAEAASARALMANENARARADEAAKKTGKHLDIGKKEQQRDSVESATAKPKAAPVKLEAPKTAVAKKSAAEAEPAPAVKSGKVAAAAEKSATTTEKNPVPMAQDKYDPAYAKYLSSITWKLRNAMYVPVETPKGLYFATVRIKCDKSGKILSSEFLDGSGDEYLDRYIMQGLKRAGSISPPPAGLGDTIDLTFSFLRK